MSESTPSRVIGGLSPRKTTDLSRLQRRNRPEASAEETSAVGALPQPAADKPRRKTPSAKTSVEPQAENGTSGQGRLSAYLASETLNRARATYRATSYLEHDRSFSEFVERAIYAEILRRENEHNNGERYEEDTSRLRPGRPLN